MLFNITQENSRLQQIEEIPNAFFNNILDNDIFGYQFFPDWFQENYGNRKDGLYKKAKDLFEVIKKSGKEEEIINGYLKSLEINQYCLDVTTVLFYCENISEELFTTAKEYFHYLYISLDSDWFTKYSKTNILKYLINFKKNNKVYLCPICGNEPIKSNKNEARAALDHWLCKSKYPFYSVNWNNLFPLGEGCNRSPVKGEKEVLWTENERINRRTFFHPFNWLDIIQINLECIDEPSIENLTNGSWKFNFIGDNVIHQDLIDKWNVFFRINDRWIDGTLSEFIETWTETFASYLLKEINYEDFEISYDEKLLSFCNARNAFNVYPQNRVEWFFLDFLINRASISLYIGYKKTVSNHLKYLTNN